MTRQWTRRAWLSRQTMVTAVLTTRRFSSPVRGYIGRLRHNGKVWASPPSKLAPTPPSTATMMRDFAPDVMQRLALQAVDATRTAGAQYADARLTRTVFHHYTMGGHGALDYDNEMLGIGVRALVNGYWGFAASPYWGVDETARLGHVAVAIAQANAKGPQRAVELSETPVVTGTWTPPVQIDPFTLPLEEIIDHIIYWKECAGKVGVQYLFNGLSSGFLFSRQERVVATSAGTLVSQTLYESGAKMECMPAAAGGAGLVGYTGENGIMFTLTGLDWAAKGWEMLTDAQIPNQFVPRLTEAIQRTQLGSRTAPVGRYTLVCDGATMASFVGQTFGAATQLDRALGYEANARGTTFIDDPLAMVGTFPVAAPSVTVTMNRSAPSQLATVGWDDEGVVPAVGPLIKNGVLVDFQTTRESAGWLAPYYRQHGTAVRSHGCAGADEALSITTQHMPNLELAPGRSAVTLDDLVKNVRQGILVIGGHTTQMDSQLRNGLLTGAMREITNGRLGRYLSGGAVLFNTMDSWKHLNDLGGPVTQATVGFSRFDWNDVTRADMKGQPRQRTSYSVQAVAAAIPNQPYIDLGRKA